MADLTIKQVTKSYGATQVMHGVDLDIEDGEFVVFVGPSGCGKSTLLRMIAGLEEISSGEISIGDRVVNEVAPSKRGVAMVFQTYALYPHMSVYNNMAFGLKQIKMPKDEIDKRVREAAKILHIEDYLDRTPKALSGGQRQRVAIGRAIVREPQVFLFDEPLSNLDAALRGQTRLEIARLHERLGSTMVYVTHDQVEAMTLADKIVVLRDGRIEQVGAPVELYENPENLFVASFIGSPAMNFFESSALSDTAAAVLGKDVDDGSIVGIRPEHLKVANGQDAVLNGKLELIEHLGEHVLVHLLAEDGTEFITKMEQPPEQARGDMIGFTADPAKAHAFDKATGKRK
ncbi:ABC transporter ATP-binding protein [Cohaesibacter gelatinilyticus]|uniref:Multiple sugar transport system ATP-binding protein/alpha-glucoside transport system ATP-binding protein n=1 Tax=Cohaesibacter gelatinilyticus TaxID=372072 RepID=A0A285PBQ6_9HYPH|nr:sn-glycerol-3-phosphate ABC transporter ATP-binding protein UgpC [Cohaesibacter gelatinilyticus]SNZ19159.1 multiple sugar transport system ATP-binding protein/alpha-glucoside transport system ATP-binding protein [Cohaesibacter gelatinilyticus]